MTSNQTNTAPDPEAQSEQLSQTQERALIALLSCSSVASAARAVDVGEATLWRWLQLPAFKMRYRELRKQATQVAVIRLQQAMGDAAEALHEVATNVLAPPAARVAAARAILDTGLRATVLEELGADLEDLEAMASEAMRRTRR